MVASGACVVQPAQAPVRLSGHGLRLPKQLRLVVTDRIVDGLSRQIEREIVAVFHKTDGRNRGQGFGDSRLIADRAANFERAIEQARRVRPPALRKRYLAHIMEHFPLEDRDTFILSGAEDLVPVLGGSAGANRYSSRTEGLFAQIEARNDFWQVRSNDPLSRTAVAIFCWFSSRY